MLTELDMDILIVPDLCGMTANCAPELRKLENTNHLTIIACYPRAVQWMCHRAGIYFKNTRVEFLNMRTQSFEEIKQTVMERKTVGETASLSVSKDSDEWIPWFPVIDYSRCKNCKQCASFCLFQVYETTKDGQVIVKNPTHCKNNCPACARICPEAAIMFPKLNEPPINGAEITDEHDVRANIKLNVEQMLGDNVYEALAERRKKAKHILLRKKALEQAREERERHVGLGKNVS